MAALKNPELMIIGDSVARGCRSLPRRLSRLVGLPQVFPEEPAAEAIVNLSKAFA